MQVKSIAHSTIFSTFIKLPFVIKIFVLSFVEWPLKTGFTVGINDISSIAFIQRVPVALLVLLLPVCCVLSSRYHELVYGL